MGTCEVFFSSGYSITVNLSQHAFVELVSCEDGLLDNRLVLLENIHGNPLYINPMQIVSVKAVFEESNEEKMTSENESANTKRKSYNRKVVKNLNEEVNELYSS